MGVLAITGGKKLRNRPFPKWPVWGEAERSGLLDVLESGNWGCLIGKYVDQFEQEYARFCEAKHAVCVNNGTVALYLSLQAAGIRPGDEVIVPPYTFIATASSVLMAGGVPVFADIDPVSFNLDPAAVEAAITPRTKAIIPVHLGGQPADMDRFPALAQQHGLRLIEDAAHAPGSEWRGQKVGAQGDIGCFSFQWSKNLNSGEGGAIVTNSDELFARAWSLHNVGRLPKGAWNEHHMLGGNFRMTEFQGALLLAQFGRLAEQTAQRERAAAILDERLLQCGITPQGRDSRCTRNAFHLYVFRYHPAEFGGLSRNQFVKALTAEGIPCSAGYQLLNKQPVFQAVQHERTYGFSTYPGYIDYANQDLPVATRLAETEGCWLPQNVLLGGEEEIDDVVRAVMKIKRNVKELL